MELKKMLQKQKITMKTSSFLVLCICFFICKLTTTTLAIATDEKIGIEAYSTLPEESVAALNKRFNNLAENPGNNDNRLLPASSLKSLGSWPKPNLQSINVKEELLKLNSSYDYDANWPDIDVHLGAVTAVSFDVDDNIVLFHRYDRIWGQNTFDNANRFLDSKLGRIPENTVLALDQTSGKVQYAWGKNLFYMPHGLTIDRENNAWVTDVALHQVFKFGPKGSNNQPLMTLGKPFKVGRSNDTFCKPTSVAVLENGDFFVADGYCNARIMKFSKSGVLILSWGQNTFSGESFEVAPKYFFAIPHAMTLIPEKGLVCVADRENGRIQCFNSSDGTFHSQYHSPIIGSRLFSMDYSPAQGGEFVIVNGNEDVLGETKHYYEIKGFVMNMSNKQVTSKFGPNNQQFQNPHDIAITKDGYYIYVAELDPPRIHKFIHTNLTQFSKPKSLSSSSGANEKLAAAGEDKGEHVVSDDAKASTPLHSRPGGTAILVSSLMLLFTFVTFALALLIARRRKRGCLPFGGKSRVHAWDKKEGFKLGGLLKDRSKHNGFERLDQDGSDEETPSTAPATAATTTLTTPFA